MSLKREKKMQIFRTNIIKNSLSKKKNIIKNYCLSELTNM